MTSPYVYKPDPQYSTFNSSNYFDPTVYNTQNSPFVPASVLNSGGFYSPSPYSTPLPPSPYGGSSPLPGLSSDYTAYPDGWTRPRRISWAGPSTPYTSPTFLDADTYFSRRSSFGASAAAAGNYAPPGWLSWAPLSPLAAHPIPVSSLLFSLHPWLNGEAPRHDFRFDLSSPVPCPQKVIDARGTFMMLSHEELRAPATHPPITRLRIICNLIPQWPIELSPMITYAPTVPAPPILFQDVLLKIHRDLHTRISHADWAKLSPTDENVITSVFNRRCASFGPNMMAARSDGVKRIDFLRGYVWFRGLIPTAEKDTMKLILSKG